MTQMLEIEYKSMLTKQEYEIFIAHYQLTDKDFRVQTNIYFDTVDEQLKNKIVAYGSVSLVIKLNIH